MVEVIDVVAATVEAAVVVASLVAVRLMVV